LPGLKYSTFASTSQGKSLVILLSRTKGVLPMVSKMLFLISMVPVKCPKSTEPQICMIFYDL